MNVFPDRIASRGVRKEELAWAAFGRHLPEVTGQWLIICKKRFTEVQISVFLYFCDSHCFP